MPISPNHLTAQLSNTSLSITTPVHAIDCASQVPLRVESFFARPNRGGSTATLGWINPPSPHTHLQVTIGYDKEHELMSAWVPAEATTYIFSTPIYGAQYCFTIRTVNDCAQSELARDCINVGSPVKQGFESSTQTSGSAVLGAQTVARQMPPSRSESINSCNVFVFQFALIFTLLVVIYMYIRIRALSPILARTSRTALLILLLPLQYYAIHQSCPSAYAVHVLAFVIYIVILLDPLHQVSHHPKKVL